MYTQCNARECIHYKQTWVPPAVNDQPLLAHSEGAPDTLTYPSALPRKALGQCNVPVGPLRRSTHERQYSEPQIDKQIQMWHAAFMRRPTLSLSLSLSPSLTLSLPSSPVAYCMRQFIWPKTLSWSYVTLPDLYMLCAICIASPLRVGSDATIYLISLQC
jgi:hypothetical protein